ncbi:MAG: hypothetical protein JW827_01230 [Spirochaetes bacterium]|nr:hypothetical protein [Spirochaetota bacterium]
MEVKFIHQNLIPYYLLLLLGLSYLTFLAYSIITIIQDKQKRLLIILRIIVWSILILSLINPVLTFYQNQKKKNKFLTLLDNSASMTVKDAGARSRFSRAMSLLDLDIFKNIEKDFDFALFLFDSQAKPMAQKPEKGYQPSGDATDIENALASVSLSQDRKIAGIFLLSDGISTVFSDPLKEARLLQKLKIPVFTFDFSRNESIKDISLYDMDYPEEAGIDALIPIKAKISLSGLNKANTLIKIFINDSFYTSKNTTLSKGLNQYSFNLKFTKTGINKVRLTLSPVSGEALEINNQKTIFIRTFKSKFKILLVYGQPGWEYKFLNYALSLDPNLETDSYLKISKDKALPISDLSLITYDLIIIGNIQYRDLPEKFVDNVLSYVNTKGGAILFLGGENGFKNGNYHISRFKNIIPVNWNKAGEMYQGNFTLNLTGLGVNTPFLRIGGGDITSLQDQWANLPPCDRLNIIKEVKTGSRILATSSARQDHIVLAVGTYKRSQIGIFTAYPSWKWGFISVGLGKGNDLYLSFWRQLVRYMVMYNVEKISITTDKLIYKKGEEISVRVSAFDNNYNPIMLKNITARLFSRVEDDDILMKELSLSPVPGTGGLYESILTSPSFGEYKLQINVRDQKKQTSFVVEKPSSELFRLNTDNEILDKISTLTKGNFFKEASEIDRIMSFLDKEKSTVRIKHEIVLWNHYLPLILVVFCLGYEWYYRKRTGLL